MWGLPFQIWLFGIVSLFGDIASEMLYPVVPIYLTTALGASYAAVGLIESSADLTAAVLKYYSGKWMDRGGKGKPLIVGGYALSNFSKPWIGYAGHWFQVLVLRSFDRLGKGLRTTPRDHLLASLAPKEKRGLAFGLHRGLDSFGAMLGPLLCLQLLGDGSVEELRTIFLLSIVPGAVTVALSCFIREPRLDPAVEKKNHEEREAATGSVWGLVKFRRFLIVWILFCLANSSDMFLLLQAKTSLGDFKSAIGLYCFYNLVYSIGGPLFGGLSDRWPRQWLLGGGFLLFAGIYWFVPTTQGFSGWLALYGLYGVFMASTDGIGRAFGTDLLPFGFRGRGLGLLNGLGSAAVFLSSVGTGLLWDHFGAAVAFGTCSALAALAGVLVLTVRPGVEASGS